MRQDVVSRSRQALFVLEFFVPESDRRVRQFGVVEGRWLGHQMACGNRRRPIVLGDKTATHMASPDAQLHQRRHVAGFTQCEAVFHHVHHAAQIGARVEQDHAGFQGIGMGSLLDDAGPLSIVFTDHHQHTAQHARRRKVRQRIGRHVGADNRLPGHRTAQRVMNRGPQHGRGRSFVGAGFHMHAQLVHVALGLHQHVHQMRDRSALVAAHIGHARLE